LPEIVILAMSAVYMSRSNRLEGKLLFAGSLIHLFVRIFYFVIPYVTVVNYDDGGTNNMQTLYFIAGMITFVGSIVFCIGLVMLVQFALSKLSKP
jgi:hypothetical protein